MIRIPTVRSLQEVDLHGLHERALPIFLGFSTALVPAFTGLVPPVVAAAALSSPADMALGHFEVRILDGLGDVSGRGYCLG